MLAGIELFCVKILRMDMGGYTFNQLALLNKYDRLLVELGEKSYGSVGSEWPVEAEIIFMCLMNAVIFLVIRLFSAYLGPGIGNIVQQIVNSFLNQSDASEHIKKAEGLSLAPDASELSEMPEATGGFDVMNNISKLASMFGGGNNNNNGNTNNNNNSNTNNNGNNSNGGTRSARKPTYGE